MKRLILVAALVAAPCNGAVVQGVGASSCATAFAPERKFELGPWVWGFWSGMNAATNSSVGESTDPAGVLGEVELFCRDHPSQTLAQAAFTTYLRLRAEKR